MNKKSIKNIVIALVVIVAVCASSGLFSGQNAQTKVNPSTPEQKETEAPEVKDEVETVPKGTDYSLPASTKGEQILHKKAMTISYNKDMRTPNWVAYLLLNNDMNGNAAREPEFYQDEEIAEKYRVSTYDYSRSGYDRGHMAPAADFSGDAEAKKQTFYMTNVCPQNHDLNGDSWNTLEKQCRDWARQEGGIYSVVGPIYTNPNPKRIGQHKVAVPDAFFRCILSLRKGHEKAIGFIYENNGNRQRIAHAACTVDEVEKKTGLDFFTALPDNIENKLESSANLADWGY